MYIKDENHGQGSFISPAVLPSASLGDDGTDRILLIFLGAMVLVFKRASESRVFRKHGLPSLPANTGLGSGTNLKTY